MFDTKHMTSSKRTDLIQAMMPYDMIRLEFASRGGLYGKAASVYTDLVDLKNAESFGHSLGVYLQKEKVPLCLHKHSIQDGTRRFFPDSDFFSPTTQTAQGLDDVCTALTVEHSDPTHYPLFQPLASTMGFGFFSTSLSLFFLRVAFASHGLRV